MRGSQVGQFLQERCETFKRQPDDERTETKEYPQSVKLYPGCSGVPAGLILYEPLKRLVLHITMLVIQSLEQPISYPCRGVLVVRKIG